MLYLFIHSVFLGEDGEGARAVEAPLPSLLPPALSHPDTLESPLGFLPVPTPQVCLLWDLELVAAAEPRRMYTCTSSEPANQLLSPRNLGLMLNRCCAFVNNHMTAHGSIFRVCILF